MKNQERKLKLSIKQDVETKVYEIQVIENTHRGNEFSPTGGCGFKHNGYLLDSCSSGAPNFIKDAFYFSHETRIGTTKDKEEVNNLIAAVEAYNNYEEVKRPDWCKDFACGKKHTREYCSGVDDGNRCDSFQEPQHITFVRENLIEYLDNKIKDLEERREAIDELATEPEMDEWKKDLMLSLIDLPLTNKYCAYCIETSGNKSGEGTYSDCLSCDYGKEKGICVDENSLFKELAKRRSQICTEIERYPLKLK